MTTRSLALAAVAIALVAPPAPVAMAQSARPVLAPAAVVSLPAARIAVDPPLAEP